MKLRMIFESPLRAFFPYLEGLSMLHSQIALWSHPVEVKESDSLLSFCLSFSALFGLNWQCLSGVCNPIPISGFCWDGWLSPATTTIISLSATPQVFSLEQVFNLSVSLSFSIWIVLECSKSLSYGSFMLKNSYFNSSLIILLKQKGGPRLHLQYFLEISSAYIQCYCSKLLPFTKYQNTIQPTQFSNL